MKKLILKLVTVTICSLTIALSFFCLDPSHRIFAQEPDIMTYEEYRRIKHKQPYILDLESGRGRLLYFGVKHVKNLNDPQIAEIEKRWAKFRPTLILSESGVRAVESSREKAIERYGEAGLLSFLAAKHNIRIKSIDPPRLDEIAHLLSTKRWTGEQIKLFFILRRVAENAKRPKPQPVDAFVKEGLKALSTVSGLEGAPATLSEFEESVRRVLPSVPDWKQIQTTVFDPNPTLGLYTNDVAYASSQYRDRYMVKLLAEEVKKGERVFAVVGASHVVMQERALRKALKQASLSSNAAPNK